MARRRRDDNRQARQLSAAELIDAVLSNHGVGDDIRERRLATEWRQTVGPRVAARTWPGQVRGQTLVLWVANSAWMHQLSFVKDELIENIRARFGDPPLVTEIRFNLGRPKREAAHELESARETQTRTPPPRRHLPASATGAALDRIQAEAAAVEDDELRAIIIEARRKLDA